MSDVGFIKYLKEHSVDNDSTKQIENTVSKNPIKEQHMINIDELENDDDFYDETIPPMSEARRLPFKPKPQQYTRTTQSPVPQKQIQQPYVDDDDYYEPPRKVVHKHTTPKVDKSTWTPSPNPALNEAYRMMGEMKTKIEEMFYRYGMSGLEKLNECMVDVFEEILNPQPIIKEVPVEKPIISEPIKEHIVKPAIKKIVKKKPIVKTTVSENKEVNPVTTENVIKTEKIKKPIKQTINTQVKETFNNLVSNCDLSSLGNCLTDTVADNKKTSNMLAKINANAALLEDSMNKTKTKKSTKKSKEIKKTIENESLQEEFEIVDDNAQIDLTEETDNLEENTEI